MGYFVHLYVVDLSCDGDSVKQETRVYGGEAGKSVYFSWGRGERPSGLHEYAGSTVVSSIELPLLPTYPHAELLGRDCDSTLVEASFKPAHREHSVLYQFILPSRFIPKRASLPLEQPSRPFVEVVDGRIAITYETTGPSTIRFRIGRLREDDSLQNYEHEKLLHPDEVKSTSVSLEVNLGVFTLKIGRGGA